MEPIHVLVVDDESDLLRTVTLILQAEGYVVTATTDPREALAVLTDPAAGADVLVSDVAMPGMSGTDLVARARHLGADVPTLLTSAYGAGRPVLEVLRVGVDDYLDKPFRAADLSERVRSLAATVRGRRAPRRWPSS